MNKTIIEDIVSERQSRIEGLKHIGNNIVRLSTAQHILERLPDVSDTVNLNAYGSTIWIEIHNREDLMIFMTLSQMWTKVTESNYIIYKAEVDGVEFQLHAYDAALPDTCKLIKEEYTVPASPERQATRFVVKCNPLPTEFSTPHSDEVQPSL